MRTKVVVVGASGFGRECLDVLEAMIEAGADVEILGVVDDGASDVNLRRLTERGAVFLGTRQEWFESAETGAEFVVGVGSPTIRRDIADDLESRGFHAFVAIHPSVTIGARTVVGEGSVICAGVTLSGNVRIAKHVHINPNATIGHDAELGEFASVNPGAVISGEVRVGSGSLIGAGAIVLQNLEVGEGSTVGAGAVVTKPVSRNETVTGVPARSLQAQRSAGSDWTAEEIRS